MPKNIKNLILKTKKVNWQELKDLQPTNLNFSLTRIEKYF